MAVPVNLRRGDVVLIKATIVHPPHPEAPEPYVTASVPGSPSIYAPLDHVVSVEHRHFDPGDMASVLGEKSPVVVEVVLDHWAVVSFDDQRKPEVVPLRDLDHVAKPEGGE